MFAIETVELWHEMLQSQEYSLLVKSTFILLLDFARRTHNLL